MKHCRSCNAQTKPVANFGTMPISNRFVDTPNEPEYEFELTVEFCPDCYLVQLGDAVEPQEMFNDAYAFFSSTSNSMQEHFKQQAQMIQEKLLLRDNPFVVELGCNDGIMLRHIAEIGIDHLGVEPSGNVALAAEQNGVMVTTEFFNLATAKTIKSQYGSADVICGSNVVCHIEDINSVFAGVSELLSRDGTFFFEDPYIFDIIKKSSFDQIYDEHLFYFSCLSVEKLASRHGLTLVDVEMLDVHGGEARYFVQHTKVAKPSQRLIDQLEREKEHNLNDGVAYIKFAESAAEIAKELRQILNELTQKGEEIIAYGATSKSATLLNYSGITNQDIKCVFDNTPAKIGKFTPRTHIPIVSYENLDQHPGKHVLLLAWNHAKEIKRKERVFIENGGKFIETFPRVRVE